MYIDEKNSRWCNFVFQHLTILCPVMDPHFVLYTGSKMYIQGMLFHHIYWLRSLSLLKVINIQGFFYTKNICTPKFLPPHPTTCSHLVDTSKIHHIFAFKSYWWNTFGYTVDTIGCKMQYCLTQKVSYSDLENWVLSNFSHYQQHNM